MAHGEGAKGAAEGAPRPSALHFEDVLGYDDWDAVAALGLRVLSNPGEASIELKRHQPERSSSEPDIQPPPGSTMSDYESDDDTGDRAAEGAATTMSKTSAST